MPRVIIVVENGVFADVIADEPVEVAILDIEHEDEESEEAEITASPFEPATLDPERVQQLTEEFTLNEALPEEEA